jgi:CubicO group peptidase (beta-lactamase class C family)
LSQLVTGTVEPGWEPVRDVLQNSITAKAEIGAGVAIVHRGKLVVDIVGGYADNAATTPYTHDTLQLVFSTTKGVVATAVAMCVERGLLGYDEPVATLWPQFAQHGKERVTVAQLLSHRAGLYTVDGDITLEEALDWNTVTHKLANTAPLFPVGSTHGYHAITFGWLAGHLVQLTDGRSIGRFIREEIAHSLNAEIYVGLPEHLEPRVSPVNTGWAKSLSQTVVEDKPLAPPPPAPGADTPLGRALSVNGAFNVKGGFNRRDVHAAEVPGANGISNARSLATMYASIIGDVHVNGKTVRLLGEETMRAASTTLTPEGERDACLLVKTTFGMGYMTANEGTAYQQAGAFGHPGAGGSVSFADPTRAMGFSYVMNRMGSALLGDVRARNLVEAASRCADASSAQ